MAMPRFTRSDSAPRRPRISKSVRSIMPWSCSTHPASASGGQRLACRRKVTGWVTPRMVVEIGFGEWTPAGLLRHPRFLGIREDKTAAEVRKEG